MARKRYSIKDRAAYHKSRMDDSTISVNKRSYSRQWMDGFTDKHPRENYLAVRDEIRFEKSRGPMSKDKKLLLYGYRNGLKAQLDRNTGKR